MGHTSIVLALFLTVLGGVASLLAFGDRWNPATRRGLWAGLLVIAAIAHTHSLTRGNGNGREPLTFARPAIHLHELVHYYLGTKYYRELGHDRLYEAIVLADYEDDRPGFSAGNRIRDLRTNRVDRVRRDVVRDGERVRGAFEDERWQAFRHDVALLRTSYPSREAWHRSSILQDHGYNGSPLTTLLLGTLANQPFVSSLTFLEIIRSLDVALLALVVGLVARRLGLEPALAFAALWLANPLNDYGFVGGSYLRYNFAWALILAWLALDRGRAGTAGIWLGIAAHLRLFPAVFAVGLLLHDLLRPGSDERRAALRESRPLYLGLAASGALLVAVTAFTPAPPGENVWAGFRDRIGVHAGALAYNLIGIDVPFAWSPEQSVEARGDALARGEPVAWEEIVADTLDERRIARWLAKGALLLAIAAVARRLPRRYAMLLGFPLLFTAYVASHYYYLALGLLALVFHDHRGALLSLTAGFAALALVAVPTAFADDVIRMGAASLVTLATLAGLALLGIRADRRAGGPPPPPWPVS